jgi:hypothetical protein
MPRQPDPGFLAPPGDFDPEQSAATPAGGLGAGGAHERVRQHETKLMSIDGVEGVAMGRSAIGEDQLTVYVRDSSVRARVPRQLDGLPVHVVVSGPIDAQ